MSSYEFMYIARNISELVTLKKAALKGARRVVEEDLSLLKRAAMICDRGRILWVGKEAHLDRGFKFVGIKTKRNIRESSYQGFSILPGFVECHTHSIFAGSRAHEFELRQNGVSYQEISKRGGGILSTVKETRKASVENLIELGQKRVDDFVRQGVTTLEIKSGYGLRLKDEMKMLEAIKGLKKVNKVATYLAAHSWPKGKSKEAYWKDVLLGLTQVKKDKLAQRVDIFIEKGFFDLGQGKELMQKARELGVAASVHADQLNRTGATKLAVDMGAQSVDHLVQINKADIKKLADSETTAVLLPAADYYLKMKYPPARALIDAGARVALATDFNPGSSPTQDLTWVGLMARMEMNMTLPEVIASYTLGAAYALGLHSQVGSLEVGKQADYMVLDGAWTDLFYSPGVSIVKETWRNGQRCFKA